MEYRQRLSETEVSGGLPNRFLNIHSHRSKRLPDGGGTSQAEIDSLGLALTEACERAKDVRLIRRTERGHALWRASYASLTPDDIEDSHFAAIVARAVPNVLRLSVAYAVLDLTRSHIEIDVEHLEAALALWRYAEASAWYVFGDLSTSTDLARLRRAVDAAGPTGLSRNEIGALFGRHKPRAAIDELCRQLLTDPDYIERTEPTKGRPVVRLVRVKRDKRDNSLSLGPYLA
jgi:hypothetical protein